MKEQDLSLEEAAELLNFCANVSNANSKMKNTTYRKIKENLMFSVAWAYGRRSHADFTFRASWGYNSTFLIFLEPSNVFQALHAQDLPTLDLGFRCV